MDAKTLARVNLNAVFRTLALLPQFDETTRELASGRRTTIQFTVPGLTTARLVVGDGRIGWFAGPGPNDVKLAFPTPTMLNKMFDGTGNPIPLKGFSKLKWLQSDFTKITDRLSYYLRPTPELLTNPEASRANSVMTLHVACYALAEIAQQDPVAKAIASRMTDGAVILSVVDGPTLSLVVKDHVITAHQGVSPAAKRASMTFNDIDIAGEVLRGELAAFTAIGRQQLHLGGYIPLLEETNKLLTFVSRYLA